MTDDLVYDFAAKQVENDVAADRIVRSLIDMGFDAAMARLVVENVNREAGKRNMLFGALWCLGTTVVTTLILLTNCMAPVPPAVGQTIALGVDRFIRGRRQHRAK